MSPSTITRPFLRLTGAALRNHPFHASCREVRRVHGTDVLISSGTIFRDSRGRVRRDIRTERAHGSLDLAQIVDPIASTVTLVDHEARSYVAMAASFDRPEGPCWTSSITGMRVPDEQLEISRSRKTIEGLDCYLIVLDARMGHEAWVSHLLGHTVREQFRDDTGIRVWSLHDVVIGDVAEDAFVLDPSYVLRD